MLIIVVTLLLKELKASLQFQLLEYEDLQRRIAQRASLYFTKFVRRRGYDGELNIDMAKKKLDIIVSSFSKPEFGWKVML